MNHEEYLASLNNDLMQHQDELITLLIKKLNRIENCIKLLIAILFIITIPTILKLILIISTGKNILNAFM